jgi:hypothetical protein
MKEHRRKQELLISALYEESGAESLQGLDESLAADSHLEREFRELKKTIEMVGDARLAEDPGTDFWHGVWPEFQRRQRALASENSDVQTRAAGRVWNWRPAMQIVIVAAMLVIGIFIGRIISEQEMNAPAGEGMQAGEVPIALPFEREIAESEQDYFYNAAGSSIERSSNLLQNFMSIEPQDWSTHRDLIARSKEAGSEILNEITSLREGLNGPRFVEIEPILNELELFVGEIAGIEGGEDDVWFEIRSLQNGIRERNLLDRLNQIRVKVVGRREKPATDPAIWIER